MFWSYFARELAEFGNQTRIRNSDIAHCQVCPYLRGSEPYSKFPFSSDLTIFFGNCDYSSTIYSLAAICSVLHCCHPYIAVILSY